MTISGERTEQLNIFCRVTGFTGDFLRFVDVELVRFFHGALHFILLWHKNHTIYSLFMLKVPLNSNQLTDELDQCLVTVV